VKKVYTVLLEVSEAKGRPLPDFCADEVIDTDVPLRGRKRDRKIMRENLLNLLAYQGKSSKDFWKLVRAWTDDKPVKPRVTLDQLHDSFKARLNPPAELPESFDANLHAIVTSLDATIPRRTTNRTKQEFFSHRITIEDIQGIKRKLQKKSFRSAVGIDDVSYAKIRTIPMRHSLHSTTPASTTSTRRRIGS
jgi:hypothetical protein